VFSGPVEGILIIVAIFAISGFYGASLSRHVEQILNASVGPSFWDTGILTVLHLTDVPFINKLPDLPLNDAFMCTAAFGVAFNLQSR
jgi:ethanolaminephosphotransferase